MKKKKVGKIPVNARITIDYSKKKPSISFKYPRKDIVEQNRYGIPLLILGLVWFFFYFFILYIGIGGGTIVGAPKDCSAGAGYKGDYIMNITLFCDNNDYFLDFEPGRYYDNAFLNYYNYIFFNYPKFYQKSDMSPVTILTTSFLLIVVLLGSLWLLIPASKYLTILLVKMNWYQKVMPEWNKMLNGRGYQAIFKEVPENKIIELPLFENIYLDYIAEKQFSKYLQRVEIREHPFNKGVKKRGRISKKKKNITLWYAKFYFSEIPRSGKLEVFFK